MIQIKIQFVAVGQRKEHDKNDIYRITQKLVDSGIINAELASLDDPSGATEIEPPS